MESRPCAAPTAPHGCAHRGTRTSVELSVSCYNGGVAKTTGWVVCIETHLGSCHQPVNRFNLIGPARAFCAQLQESRVLRKRVTAHIRRAREVRRAIMPPASVSGPSGWGSLSLALRADCTPV
eukprot:scaffold2879_cov269-Prasinococcus_capsulatus_cf.AAC.35